MFALSLSLQVNTRHLFSKKMLNHKSCVQLEAQTVKLGLVSTKAAVQASAGASLAMEYFIDETKKNEIK